MSTPVCAICQHDPRRCSPHWCDCPGCEMFTQNLAALLEDARMAGEYPEPSDLRDQYRVGTD